MTKHPEFNFILAIVLTASSQFPRHNNFPDFVRSRYISVPNRREWAEAEDKYLMKIAATASIRFPARRCQ